MYYTSGNTTYANADLSLSLGDGLGGNFASLSTTPSRTWDGTINYSRISTAPEPASALPFLSAPAVLLLRRRYLRKY